MQKIGLLSKAGIQAEFCALSRFFEECLRPMHEFWRIEKHAYRSGMLFC
jgi:hypothetical protein